MDFFEARLLLPSCGSGCLARATAQARLPSSCRAQPRATRTESRAGSEGGAWLGASRRSGQGRRKARRLSKCSTAQHVREHLWTSLSSRPRGAHRPRSPQRVGVGVRAARPIGRDMLLDGPSASPRDPVVRADRGRREISLVSVSRDEHRSRPPVGRRRRFVDHASTLSRGAVQQRHHATCGRTKQSGSD